MKKKILLNIESLKNLWIHCWLKEEKQFIKVRWDVIQISNWYIFSQMGEDGINFKRIEILVEMWFQTD